MDRVDASGPAERRSVRPPAFAPPPPAATWREVRRNNVPAPDWTGIRFKAVAELAPVDFNHRGRASGPPIGGE